MSKIQIGRIMNKFLAVYMLIICGVMLQSCGWSLPEEHIEIELDMHSIHKEIPKEKSDLALHESWYHHLFVVASDLRWESLWWWTLFLEGFLVLRDSVATLSTLMDWFCCCGFLFLKGKQQVLEQLHRHSLSDSIVTWIGGSPQRGKHMKWLFVILSLVGSYLNIRNNKYCFFFWLSCDSFFAYKHIMNREYDEALLFIIYGLFAIYGYSQWCKKYTS